MSPIHSEASGPRPPHSGATPFTISYLYLAALLALAIGLQGCGTFNSGAGGPQALTDTLSAGFAALDSSMANEPGPRGADFSLPSAEKWADYAGRTITTLSGPLVRSDARPQGNERGAANTHSRDRAIMGNLAADAIRVTASATFGRRVDIGLLPTDLIRGAFSDSTVTRADVMRMVPLDEELITVEVTGTEVRRIAALIARDGGIAISGMRMQVRDGRPAGVLIQATTPDPGGTYEVCLPYSFRHSPAMEQALSGREASETHSGYASATSGSDADWGQERFTSGGRPAHRLNITLQAAVMQYLEDRPQLRPVRDGRLRNRQADRIAR